VLHQEKVLRDGVRKQSCQMPTNSETTKIAKTPQLLSLNEIIQQEKLKEAYSLKKEMGGLINKLNT